jgi:acetyl esterase/lipase
MLGNMRAYLLTLCFTCALASAQDLPAGVKLTANQSYGPEAEQKLDIIEPAGGPAEKRPTALVIHGGGWVGGTKEAVMKLLVMPLVNQGFVVANVEYRLAGKALAPAAVQDVLLAADWWKSNAGRYGGNGGRIVAVGDSAGGHLALMTGIAPKQAKLGPTSNVAAVINWYGITDVIDLLEGQHLRDYAEKWVPPSLNDRIEIARRVSPVSWVRKGLPPILTIHGDADQVVPYEHGVDLTRMLRDTGVDAELVPIQAGDHGQFGEERTARIWAQIFDFLRKRKLMP